MSHSRRLFLTLGAIAGLALLSSASLEAQNQASKQLKLKNSSGKAVEYGLGTPAARRRP